MLETKNLIIKESVFADCSKFAEWESNPDVSKFFTIDEERNYEEVVTEYVRYNLDPTKLQFTIYLKEDGRPIGRVYLSNINRSYDSLDITRLYIADSTDRGHGYGEEALRQILDYAFLNLHTERVTIDFFEGNKIAAALYTKVGFSSEGLMRHAGKKNGKYINLQLKSMLRSEYYEKIHTK